ncbi:MAG: hypothetical protein ACOCRX_09565 [Candidatus Woesearchaeota archaeon]
MTREKDKTKIFLEKTIGDFSKKLEDLRINERQQRKLETFVDLLKRYYNENNSKDFKETMVKIEGYIESINDRCVESEPLYSKFSLIFGQLTEIYFRIKFLNDKSWEL